MKFIFLLMLLFSYSSFASTAFFVDGTQSMAMAKSYDWRAGHGMVLVNKRNVQKKSFKLKETDKEHEWTSLYGSVTFNQFATEMPIGGINEKGLTIEATFLGESEYPAADDRPSMNELQWLQFLLDSYQSVQEVLENLREVRLSGVFGKFHFLICDRTKSCIVVESLNGTVISHSSAKVLTNNNYTQSLEHLALFEGFGGSLPIPSDNSSLSRFVKINHQVKEFRRDQRNNVIEASFTMLNSVRHALISNGETTVWNLIYDLQNMRVHFVHTLVGMKKYVNFSELDFTCKTPKKIYNVESHQQNANIVPDLLDYKKSFNQRIIQLSLSDMMTELSTEDIKRLIELPENYSCLED